MLACIAARTGLSPALPAENAAVLRAPADRVLQLRGEGGDVDAVFGRFDQNGRGALDVSELTAALVDLGLAIDTPAA